MVMTLEQKRAYNRPHSRKYFAKNRETMARKKREKRQNDPAWKAREYLNNRLRKFGITYEQMQFMWVNQLGGCAICEMDLPTPESGYIDHNHTTGKVRGLLCNQCNTGLGMFRESLKSLSAAAAYLAKHSV